MEKFIIYSKKSELVSEPETEAELEIESKSNCSEEMETNALDTDSNQDTEMDAENENMKKPKKKKVKRKKFCHKWKKQFKWLEELPRGCHFFKFKPCGKHRKGGLSEIKHHEAHKIHRKNAAGYQCKSRKMFTHSAQAKKENEISKRNEMRIAMFILEHNLSIACVDHLIELLKSMDPKSILKKISCARTKCSAIIKYVIGEISREEVLQHMRNNQFSLIIDESTDTST